MTSHDATPGTRAGTHRAGPVKNTGHAAGPGPVSAAARALWRERAPGPAGTPHRHPQRHRGAQRSPRREVLAVREFGGLWHAQVLSAAGDQLAQIAVAVVAYEQTRSAFLTALVYAMSCLPQVIGGPLLAEVAGLLPRRTVMIGLKLSRAAIAAIMALSRMPFAALCALLVIAVMLGASFSATRAATLPEVLPAGQLMAGAEISSIGSRAGQALGFLAGGAAVAVLRPGGLLMVAAVMFLTVAGIISWLASRCPAGQPRPHGRPLALPVTRAEAAAVMRQPLPRVLLLLGWLAGSAAQLISPRAAIAVTGLAGLVAAAVLAGTWRRVLGRIGRPAPW